MFDKKAKPSPVRQRQLDHYREMVEEASPKSAMLSGIFRAYWVGGTICVIGQLLMEAAKLWLEMNQSQASTFASCGVVFLTALLTGIGVFDKIAKFAGGGTLLPITGFANAVASPAIDSRSEGFVLGVGAKIFTVAGPVLLYGTAAGMLYGVIYWICTLVV